MKYRFSYSFPSNPSNIRGIAQCLAEEGSNIVVHYRTHPEEVRDVAEAVEAMGGQALLVKKLLIDHLTLLGTPPSLALQNGLFGGENSVG